MNITLNDVKNNLLGVTIIENCELSLYNRYRTGGKARFLVIPNTVDELIKILNFVKNKYKYYVLGFGSNVLISDKDFDGFVIVTKNLTKIDLKSNLLIAECGTKIQDVIKEMNYNSFGGLEFAIGIPASVGGAVAMNAGCYNKTVGERVRYVVTENGTYSNTNCKFDYRTSRFLNSETILKVCFDMQPMEEDIIEEKLALYKGLRKNPKGKNSGSIFKNDGYFAGKIIDEVGLKGFSVGGAKISTEHANFIIAEDGCTSQNIYDLIHIVKNKVLLEKDINLTEEIVYLGDFDETNL